MNKFNPTEKAQILIVDDEEDFRELLAEIISRSGYSVRTAADGMEALELLQHHCFDAALIDFLMPGMNGVELMREMKRIDCDLAIIFITGQGSIESAVRIMKEGAYDYITKPIQFEELENLLRHLFETRRLLSENRQLKQVLREKYSFENIVGNSRAMMGVLRNIEAAVQSEEPVLIQGEVGTGKELVAKTIHFHGSRADKPFLPYDCSVLDEEFLIDEWMGRKAKLKEEEYSKQGIFRLARGGTVYLKRISALPLGAQKILSEILATHRVLPGGNSQPVPIDVRIIVSSEQELREAVRLGRFDAELYATLSQMEINLPPLRERLEDIPALVDHFCRTRNPEMHVSLAPESLQILQRHSWPQNVWELERLVESISAGLQGDTLLPEHFPEKFFPFPPESPHLKSLAEIEEEAIRHALIQCEGDLKRTAAVLQISRSTLYRKIRKYNIPH